MTEAYPPGITVETLGTSVPVDADRAALLLRVRYAPGSHIPSHTDPGTGVWLVEHGTIGFAVQQGTAQITRAGSAAAVTVEPGTAVELQPGDTASYGPDTVHTSRNAGDADAVILIGGVYAVAQPLVRPAT